MNDVYEIMGACVLVLGFVHGGLEESMEFEHDLKNISQFSFVPAITSFL